MNDSILNGDNTVRSTFKDINPVNLHLLWEPLILLWADKLSTLNLGISSKMLVDMRKSASAYNTRKIQEVGDRVFAIGPNLQHIMDYLDNQALLFNEVSEAPIAIEKSISSDSGLTSPLPPPKTRRERVLEVSYNDWRRQSSSNDNTSNSNSSSNGQDNHNCSSSKNSGNGNYYHNNNNNRASDDRKNFMRSNSENHEHENLSRNRANNEDGMRGTSDGNATRHETTTRSRPGQDDGRDRDGGPKSDSQCRPQTGRRLSDILDGRKGNHQSQSQAGWSQDQSSRQTYSHNSSSSNTRNHEYDSNQRSSTMNAMDRSRPYSSAPSHASPYLKGANQGVFRGQRQGQGQGSGSGQVQENQGFDRMHISRQVATAEADASLRRTSQCLNETTRNNRCDGRGGGRDHGQQERDNNDLQYGR